MNTSFGVERDQAGAAQRFDLHQVEVGRHEQRVHVLRELDGLDLGHGDLGGAPQHVEQADAEVAREALVQHFQRRHAPTHDAVLVGQIVAARLGTWRRGGSVYRAAVDTVQQCVDFVLV